MAGLALDDVRDIGITAVRRVIGDTFSDVDVHAEQGWLNGEVLVFTLRLSSQATWQAASDSAVRLMTAIIDGLWEKGDARFPHVRLLSDGGWALARDAAAE